VAADPTQPNLRQVHLIQAELHEELWGQGFEVPAGGAGRERHHPWDRSAQLCRGSVRLGPAAVVEVTGLRGSLWGRSTGFRWAC